MKFRISLAVLAVVVGMTAGCWERPTARITDSGATADDDMGDGSEMGLPPELDAGADEVASVVVEPSTLDVVVNTTEDLTATAYDADGDEVGAVLFTWSTSNEDVADVAASGTVIAVSEGSATITASTDEGISGSAQVDVIPPQVAEIDVVPKQRTLDPGETVRMTVSLYDDLGGFIDESERVIDFTSDEETVVTVDGDGLVTAVGPGEATVTVSSEGVSTTAVFTVNAPELERIEVTPESPTMVPGDTLQLSTNVVWLDDVPGEEPDFAWTSSDDAVASVTDGLVTAKAEGSATITASAAGETATANVEVVFDFRAIAAGGAHACGLVENVVFCWGENGSGQLGHSSGPDPGRVETSLRFDSVSAGGSHTCGVAADGHAYCWGANTYGQLGDGTTTSSTAPVQVGTNIDFVNVAAGVHHSCGVDTTGELFCWGRGADGRLGDISSDDEHSPVSVGTFQLVFPGDRHTCATDASGTGYCWGDNDNGQLGLDETSDFENEPQLVTGGFGFSSFDPGDSHTCGMTTSGAAACWGLNTSGQVGDGSNLQRVTPILMPNMLQLARLTSGAFHSCGLTAAGDAYCWGEAGSGQLGNGATTDENEPVAVDTTLKFDILDAGADFTCGITTDADVYCWGAGGAGQVGPNSGTTSVPVAVF